MNDTETVPANIRMSSGHKALAEHWAWWQVTWNENIADIKEQSGELEAHYRAQGADVIARAHIKAMRNQGLTQTEAAALLDVSDRQLRNLEEHGLEARGAGKNKRYHPRALHWYMAYKRREKRWRDTRNQRDQIDWLPMRAALLEYDLSNALDELADQLSDGAREQIKSPPTGFRPAW